MTLGLFNPVFAVGVVDNPNANNARPDDKITGGCAGGGASVTAPFGISIRPEVSFAVLKDLADFLNKLLRGGIGIDPATQKPIVPAGTAKM